MTKPLISSVGQGGINNARDVMTVQYLLNCVPAKKGGPMMKLKVDGVSGPKTVAAIIAFQKANVPWTDGRVDPNKKTLEALQDFDTNPSAPMVFPDDDAQKKIDAQDAPTGGTTVKGPDAPVKRPGAAAPPPGNVGVKRVKPNLWGPKKP